MGRPSKFTLERAATIASLIAVGTSAEEAAAEVGIGPRTLHDWLARGRAGEPEYAKFLKAYEVAVETAAERRGRIRAVKADGQPNRRAKMKAWYRKKLGPAEYWRRRIRWHEE